MIYSPRVFSTPAPADVEGKMAASSARPTDRSATFLASNAEDVSREDHHSPVGNRWTRAYFCLREESIEESNTTLGGGVDSESGVVPEGPAVAET